MAVPISWVVASRLRFPHDVAHQLSRRGLAGVEILGPVRQVGEVEAKVVCLGQWIQVDVVLGKQVVTTERSQRSNFRFSKLL